MVPPTPARSAVSAGRPLARGRLVVALAVVAVFVFVVLLGRHRGRAKVAQGASTNIEQQIS